jgi:hypothetical protein
VRKMGRKCKYEIRSEKKKTVGKNENKPDQRPTRKMKTKRVKEECKGKTKDKQM